MPSASGFSQLPTSCWCGSRGTACMSLMGAARSSFVQGEEAQCDSRLLVLLPRGLERLPRRVCETSLLFSCFCYSSASALLTPISCNFSI